MTLRAEWLAFLAGMGESTAPTPEQWVYIRDWANRAAPEKKVVIPMSDDEMTRLSKHLAHWSNDPKRCRRCGLYESQTCAAQDCPRITDREFGRG